VIGLLAVFQAVATAAPQPISADQCRRAQNGEIVVCGSRRGDNPYRLPKVTDKYERQPIRAETDAIPGVHTQAQIDAHARSDGYVAKRLMLTFRAPF
jgi:hypothetical protein